MVKQISDNKVYLLIKYIKSILWIVAKRLSYIEDARCLKINILLCFMAALPSRTLSFIHLVDNVINSTVFVYCIRQDDHN